MAPVVQAPAAPDVDMAPVVQAPAVEPEEEVQGEDEAQDDNPLAIVPYKPPQVQFGNLFVWAARVFYGRALPPVLSWSQTFDAFMGATTSMHVPHQLQMPMVTPIVIPKRSWAVAFDTAAPELPPPEPASNTLSLDELLVEDKYQVVDFELNFTSSHAGQDEKVAIAQFCVRHDVLVYYYHPATRPCEHFASTNNKQNSLIDLASAIIDPYYMNMQNESKKDKNVWHSAWDHKLDEEDVKHAAKESYTSYEMYRKIVDMRKCLLHAPDVGSSHREVTGVSQEVDD
ncbi:hypothetical protein D1007_48534 [Hordeum vulgare]|nr:hypothetical protein D1007_48534 [Hordeum vulgare]